MVNLLDYAKKNSVLITLFVVGIAFYIVYRKIAKGNTTNKITKDPDIELASLYYSALDTESLFSSPDITELFELAQKTTSYEDVADEYNVMYNRNLTIDLQKALSTQYSYFLQVLKRVSNTKTGSNAALSTELIDNIATDIFENTGYFSTPDCGILAQFANASDGEFTTICNKVKALLVKDNDDSTLEDFFDKIVILQDGVLTKSCEYQYEDIILKRLKKLNIS